jgi:nucleoside-diphosphate-sugar epimerase
MIAVVTGSTGFIGSHLVDALLARGATVRALYRPETPAALRDDRVAAYEVDLLDDRSVRESAVWKGATHLFHLAGITQGRTLAQMRAGNVTPTAHVLAALAARDGTPPRVVLVSSQAAAGPASSGDRPVRESDIPSPIEDYGRSKLEAERVVEQYRSELAVTIVRPCTVYGPRDRDFVEAFRQASHRVAFHAAPRDQQFSIVHVDDLVRALILSGDVSDAVGRTYFVAGETPTTWRELYRLVAKEAGVAPLEIQLPLSGLRLAARAADLVDAVTGHTGLLNGNKIALARPRWWLCDASLARAELGWQATVSLQDGIRETYLWYIGEGWLRGPKVPETQQTTEESNAC